MSLNYLTMQCVPLALVMFHLPVTVCVSTLCAPVSSCSTDTLCTPITNSLSATISESPTTHSSDTMYGPTLSLSDPLSCNIHNQPILRVTLNLYFSSLFFIHTMSMSLFSSPYVDEPHELATPETEEDARVMCDIEYLNVNDDVHIEEHTAPKHAQVYKRHY